MGKLYKVIIIIIFTALLVLTFQLNRGIKVECYAEMEGMTTICDDHLGYTYMQPKWIFDTDWRTRSVSISTYNDPPSDEEREYLDQNYNYQTFIKSSSCSPATIGISSPDNMEVPGADNVTAGRMDYYEVYWTMDFPFEFTDICGSAKDQIVYAFCSEKNDKRVVICISQQTDDSKMAEEIFKTFKWIK